MNQTSIQIYSTKRQIYLDLIRIHQTQTWLETSENDTCTHKYVISNFRFANFSYSERKREFNELKHVYVLFAWTHDDVRLYCTWIIYVALFFLRADVQTTILSVPLADNGTNGKEARTTLKTEQSLEQKSNCCGRLVSVTNRDSIECCVYGFTMNGYKSILSSYNVYCRTRTFQYH